MYLAGFIVVSNFSQRPDGIVWPRLFGGLRMLAVIMDFWEFFFMPLFSLDIDSPVYAPFCLVLLVLVIFVFVRRVLSWCFSL